MYITALFSQSQGIYSATDRNVLQRPFFYSRLSSVSRYNMRSRNISVSAQPSRKKRHAVNYTEQGVKDSGNDSDFELVLKPQRPLDNKSFLTPTALQKEIELNKTTK